MPRERIDSLEVIDVASPCPANWDAMTGDDRVRHCSQCDLNVYNLSEMTSGEALRLVNQTEGRLCVRFLRRADGTMITRDCPVGLRAIRRRIARAWIGAWIGAWTGVAATIGAVVGGFFLNRRAEADGPIVFPAVELEVAQGGARPPVEMLGDVYVTPPLRVNLNALKQSPAKLVEVIRTIQATYNCPTLAQPDPQDTDAMSERDRQRIEARLRDPSWTGPAAESGEHQLLLQYLEALQERYPNCLAHSPSPAEPPDRIIWRHQGLLEVRH